MHLCDGLTRDAGHHFKFAGDYAIGQRAEDGKVRAPAAQVFDQMRTRRLPNLVAGDDPLCMPALRA
jgi:hypothetical protein